MAISCTQTYKSPIILAALVLLATAALLAPPQAHADANPIKNCLPQKLDAVGKINLSDYKGKVVYLDFWASWCGPCRASFPFMNELQKEFANDVVIVGVSVDSEVKDAKSFLADTPAAFQLAIDTQGVCPQEFGVKGMPSSYIFDRNGELVYSHEGFRKADPQKLHEKLTEIVNAKK